LASVFEAPTEEPAPITGVDERFVDGIVSLLNELRKHGKDIIRSDEYAEITRGILSGVFDVFDNELDAKANRELNKKRSISKTTIRGIEAVLSKAHLRLLVSAADTIGPKDPHAAADLLRLVQALNPYASDIGPKLQMLKRKEGLLQLNKYAITYSSVAESLDPEERRKQGEEFGAWLTSFADCIDGALVNVLKDTNSLKMEKAVLVRKPSISAGFVIVRVESEEAAYSIAARCPHLLHGGTVFVSEMSLITP
jgi:hypothetical protein